MIRLRLALVSAGLAASLSVAGSAAAQGAGSPLAPLTLPQTPAPRTLTAPDAAPTPGVAADAAIPSFSQLFRQVTVDFRNLPSRENAMWLGIGAGLAGLSKPAERDLTEDWTRPGWHETFLGPGAIMGNSYLHVGAAFALYTAGRVTHHTRVGRFGADLARAQILTQATTFGIKFAADRTRPNGDPRSFPSGHTSSMFATATVVQQHFGWKAGVPAFAAAAYVGASRIQDNKHYLSDVAFGAALGIMAGRTVTLGHRTMKFALTPVGAPGGGVGIGLTRVTGH